MSKTKFFLLSTVLIAVVAYATSCSLKNKKQDTEKTHSLTSDRVIKGPCVGQNMNSLLGVCICDEGYVANGNICEKLIDVGMCENKNVYLSYMSGPCTTDTPMEGKNCNSDNDCVGAGWATNLGCCDTNTKKCKSWVWDEESRSPNYICPKENKFCRKNSDCKKSEFCNLVSSRYDSEKPDTGTCTPLGRSTVHTYINGINKTFLLSSNRLTWWSAENWCKAQDKSLISYNTLKKLFNCDKNRHSCDWDKFTKEKNWQDGKTLPDYYCTSENYNSSNIWIVFVHAHLFNNYGRDITSYVLCE